MTDETQETLVTTQDVDNSASVRSVATIVKFTTHAWGARAKDSDASAALAHLKNATQDNVGTFTKELLAGADTEYKELMGAIRGAKAIHQRMTLPYAKGLALLANDRIWEYTEQVGKAKEEIKQKRVAFEAVYPAAMQKALVTLGDLADASKYPAADVVGGCFGVEIEFLPVPDGEDFKHLPKQFSAALATNLNDTIRDRVQEAMQDGWKRLTKAIVKLRNKMKDKDAKRLFSSSITHIQDMNKLVSDFNITNDPSHAAIVQLVDTTLCYRDMDKIRHSEILKEETAAACDHVLDAMYKAGLGGEEIVTVDVRSLRTEEGDNDATPTEDSTGEPAEPEQGSTGTVEEATVAPDAPSFPTLDTSGDDDVSNIFRRSGLLGDTDDEG